MTSYDPTNIRSQQDDWKEAEARKRLKREAEILDLKWLMSSKRGRRIMWRLLEISGPFRLSFDQNAMRMAFNEGNRRLGNELFAEVMTYCPEQYPAMVKEQQDERDGNAKQSN